MKPIEEKILLYSELSPDERAEVDSFVAAHPEFSELLGEVRALDSLLQEARAFSRPSLDEPVLAYYVASRFLGRHPMPKGLRKVVLHIEAVLEKDPQLREKYDVFERRMRELEAGSDAVAQFERLAGYPLTPQGEQATASAGDPVPLRARPDRPSRGPARIFRLSRRSGRWAVAASVALVALYGALFLFSEASRAPLDRSLRLDEYAGASYGPHVRSGNVGAISNPADSLYFRALRTLAEARRSTFGLFPHYDADRLRQAAEDLREVLARTEPNSYLYLEAQFLLGKIYLAQGDFAAAETALEAVVAGQGSHMEEARELLEQIRARSF